MGVICVSVREIHFEMLEEYERIKVVGVLVTATGTHDEEITEIRFKPIILHYCSYEFLH